MFLALPLDGSSKVLHSKSPIERVPVQHPFVLHWRTSVAWRGADGVLGLFAFARRVGSVSVNVMMASKVSVSEHLIHISGVGVAEAVAKRVGVPTCA